MIKYKTHKEARFHPYDDYEVINVPIDRHKLTGKQLKKAHDYFKHRICCKICGVRFDDKNLAHIDHCHVTGVIRGKLCRRCNIAIGLFKDSIGNLNRAISYLEYFKYSPDMVEPDLWNDE